MRGGLGAAMGMGMGMMGDPMSTSISLLITSPGEAWCAIMPEHAAICALDASSMHYNASLIFGPVDPAARATIQKVMHEDPNTAD